MNRERLRRLLLIELGVMAVIGLCIAAFWQSRVADAERRKKYEWAMERELSAFDRDMRSNAARNVRALLEKMDPELRRRAMKRDPLWWASRAGNVEVMKYMLDLGEPVNGPKNSGRPLLAATGSSNPAAVWLLLSKGADARILSDRSFSPLGMAAVGGQYRIVQLLLQAGAGPDVMIEYSREPPAGPPSPKAAPDGDFAKQHRPPPLSTPLMLAVAHSRPEAVVAYGPRSGDWYETVHALVAGGSRIHERGSDGKSAMDLAKEMGDPVMVALLHRLSAPQRAAPASGSHHKSR